ELRLHIHKWPASTPHAIRGRSPDYALAGAALHRAPALYYQTPLPSRPPPQGDYSQLPQGSGRPPSPRPPRKVPALRGACLSSRPPARPPQPPRPPEFYRAPIRDAVLGSPRHCKELPIGKATAVSAASQCSTLRLAPRSFGLRQTGRDLGRRAPGSNKES